MVMVMKMMMMIMIMIMMMMMMMVMMMMMMMMIAFKRANRDFFYNLLTAPRTVSNMYAKLAREYLCANHVQHIEQLYRATRREPPGTKGQFSH